MTGHIAAAALLVFWPISTWRSTGGLLGLDDAFAQVFDKLGRVARIDHELAVPNQRLVVDAVVVGAAYKKNVDDIRESPALKILSLLRERGVQIDYYDPYIPEIRTAREHAELSGLRSIEWSVENLKTYDAALICTDHDGVDYEALVRNCQLVVDTRNATQSVNDLRERIVKA